MQLLSKFGVIQAEILIIFKVINFAIDTSDRKCLGRYLINIMDISINTKEPLYIHKQYQKVQITDYKESFIIN